jgi:hypothetical protein
MPSVWYQGVPQSCARGIEAIRGTTRRCRTDVPSSLRRRSLQPFGGVVNGYRIACMTVRDPPQHRCIVEVGTGTDPGSVTLMLTAKRRGDRGVFACGGDSVAI